MMMRAQRTYLENEWNRQNRLNELVCYFDFVVIASRSSYLFLLIRAPEFLLIRDTLYTNNVVISAKRFSFFLFCRFNIQEQYIVKQAFMSKQMHHIPTLQLLFFSICLIVYLLLVSRAFTYANRSFLFVIALVLFFLTVCPL